MQHIILVKALCEILHQCSTEGYYIVKLGNPESGSGGTSSIINGDLAEDTNNKKREPDEQLFHERLRIESCATIGDVEKHYKEGVSDLYGQYGVLLFLYSVVATKVPWRLSRRQMRQWAVLGSRAGQVGIGHKRPADRPDVRLRQPEPDQPFDNRESRDVRLG